MEPKVLNNKTIVAVLLIFFIITPLVAWFTTPRIDTETSRTNDEFSKLIDEYNHTSADQDKIPAVTIQSSRRVQDVWYVLNITAPDSSEKGIMVVADFYHDPERMEIVVKPFQPLPYKNISIIGMPYSIIDDVNANLAEGGKDNE